MQTQSQHEVKVKYEVSCRLPMLHGGFLPHTFSNTASFAIMGPNLVVPDAKAQLETLFIRKYRARRIKWLSFDITEVKAID